MTDLAARDIALTDLHAELAARLGPTTKQLKRIARWERGQRSAGAARTTILAGARARARIAVTSRAEGIGSSEFARMLGRSRTEVFREARVLIYSENQRDQNVRDLHRAQTRLTLADPRPPGAGWTPAAPFRGPHPFERG